MKKIIYSLVFILGLWFLLLGYYLNRADAGDYVAALPTPFDIIMRDCVSYWPMDNDSDSMAVTDEKGYAQGTFNSITGSSYTKDHSVAGFKNTALYFDGDDKIYFAAGKTFSGTFDGDHTFIFWIKPDDGQYAGGPQPILAVDTDLGIWNEIWLNPDGKLASYYCTAMVEDVQAYTNDVIFADGQAPNFKMIALVIKQTGVYEITMEFYVDGIIKSVNYPMGQGSDMSLYSASCNPYIGRLHHCSTGPGGEWTYRGAIDEFIIFNRALTSTEINVIKDSL